MAKFISFFTVLLLCLLIPTLPAEQPPAPQSVSVAQGKDRVGTITPLPLGNLRAEPYKTTDGRTGWKISIPGNHPLTTPAVVDGMVYVGGGFGSYEFYAFDQFTGKARWAIRVSDDGPTAAVVRDGVVVFNTESCTLFVVDAQRGTLLWSRWLGDPLMSQPAIAEGKVFMAYPAGDGHRLVALGLKDGKELWHAPIKGDIISAPVVYGSSVYVTTFDGTVYRFASDDGKLVWQKDFKATSAPWLYEDQVFVSQREDKDPKVVKEGIARMENTKGEQNQPGGSWRQKSARYIDPKVQRNAEYYAKQKVNDSAVGFSNAPASAKTAAAEMNVGQGTVQGLWEYQGSRPCVYRGRLYLTQGDEVVALDPVTGKELWSRNLAGDLERIGGHLAAPPSPAGEKLYVATATGQILIVSQAKGATLDAFQLGSPVRFQPSLSKGMIFIGAADGTLYGINLKDDSADGWTMWGGSAGHNR